RGRARLDDLLAALGERAALGHRHDVEELSRRRGVVPEHHAGAEPRRGAVHTPIRRDGTVEGELRAAAGGVVLELYGWARRRIDLVPAHLRAGPTEHRVLGPDRDARARAAR